MKVGNRIFRVNKVGVYFKESHVQIERAVVLWRKTKIFSATSQLVYTMAPVGWKPMSA